MEPDQKRLTPVSRVALAIVSAHGPLGHDDLANGLGLRLGCTARVILSALAKRGLVSVIDRPTGAFVAAGGRQYEITEEGREELARVG